MLSLLVYLSIQNFLVFLPEFDFDKKLNKTAVRKPFSLTLVLKFSIL